MAARESQGMQIALIIFVVLTVLLSVSTYMFFDKYQQGLLKVEATEHETRQAQDAQTIAERDLREVSIKVLGTGPKADVADILKAHRDDIEKLYPIEELEKTPTYHELVSYLATTVRQSDSYLISARQQVIDHEKQIKRIEATKDRQLGVFRKTADDATVRYTGFTKDYNDEYKEFARKTGDAMEATERSIRDAAKREAFAAEELSKKDAVIRKLQQHILELKSHIHRPELVGTKIADGRITSVNQSRKTAFINLGSADVLRRRTRFQVFPDNNEAIGDAKPKATIEVTRVLAGHRAEVRITDAELLKPVMEGDRIYNETWIKGKRSGFALAGFMDIDGDGRDDRGKVIAIIRQNGGKIDAQVHPDGRVEGEMTLDTDFLLTGTYLREPRGNKAAQQGYEAFAALAERNKTTTVRLATYLRNLNYPVVVLKKKRSFRLRNAGDKKNGAY